MRLLFRSHGFRPRLPSKPIPCPRQSSTLDPTSLESSLKARKLPILYDYLTPQPSHLLLTTLADFLPFLSSSSSLPASLPSISNPRSLPPGHHLVYFPPPTRPSSLLPDGTDTLHSPGPPFTHRLWAGGHIRFPRRGRAAGRARNRRPILLDGTRAAVVEGIRSVRLSNPAPAAGAGADVEKVFVGIERRVSYVGETEGDDAVRARVWTTVSNDEIQQNGGGSSSSGGDGEGEGDDESILVERRELCFLRPNDNYHNNTTDMRSSITSTPTTNVSTTTTNNNKHGNEIDDDNDTTKKPSKPSLPPPSGRSPTEFTHSLTPTPHLLTRYSALTYNAHAIHLDPVYTRTRYHLPDLLVHGPLLLTLMLTCLEHELGRRAGVGVGVGVGVGAAPVARPEEGEGETIREISYRCLRPVFVGEEIRVCGRRRRKTKGTRRGRSGDDRDDRDDGDAGWEVWIEKAGSGLLAVRGTLRTDGRHSANTE